MSKLFLTTDVLCQLILKTNRSMIPLSWNYDTVTKKQKQKKKNCCEKFHVGSIFFLLSTWTKGSVLLHSSAVGAAIMSDNLGRCILAMQFKADLLRRPFVLFFWVLDAFFGSSLSGLYWCHCCFKKCYINTFYFPTYCIKCWRTGVWNFFK